VAAFSDDLQKGDEGAFIAAVRDITASTHNNPDVVASAEFFAKILSLILRSDVKPLDAINQVS